MSLLLLSLVPVFLTILVGTGLRRTLLPERAVWVGLERLAYFVLFPALLVRALAGAPLTPADAWPLVLATVAAIGLTGAIAYVLRRPLRLSGPRFASVFQGATRFNTYVILGVSEALLGAAGLALASVALGFMIVTSNVLAVLVLVRYGGDETAPDQPSPPLLRPLLTNPLIIACIIGLALNVTDIALPRILSNTLDFVGSAAVGIGLLAVGAALQIERVFESGRAVVITCALKLAVQPAIFLLIATLMAVDPDVRLIGVVCTSVPVATSAYVMTSQLGGDADLMARLITATTVVAMITMISWLGLVTGLT